MTEPVTPESSIIELSARIGAMMNVVHAFIYFAPEAFEEYEALGLPEDSYFAPRAAPMGPVSSGVVLATFFNFAPHRVASEIPSSWEIASPVEIQQSRFRAVDRVLNGAVGDALSPEDIQRATEILQAMISGVEYSGRPVAAANLGVPMPTDPMVALWQLITIAREWRGDAHVAALVAAGLTAREALVLHAATGQFNDALRATRGWTEEDWADTVADLSQRGLVNADGSFTDAGQEVRAALETQTDAVSVRLVTAVGSDLAEELFQLLRPLRRAILSSGIYPWTKKA